MITLPFIQVDAFADRPFSGNPAAVILLDAWLDDALLQAIAAENNLSETAFIVPNTSDAADYSLRWFTPTVEVALCGHATLAAGHAVLEQQPERQKVIFSTVEAGLLEVSHAADGYAMALPNWAATPRPLPELAAALGGPVQDTLWHGKRYAVFVFPDAAAVAALEPDFAALKAHGDVLIIATAPGAGSSFGTDVVSRAFAPGGGIDEDPVTGSAHCAITAYWCERLGRPSFSAYQASARGGYLGCELAGDKVVLTGKATTVITGTMRV